MFCLQPKVFFWFWSLVWLFDTPALVYFGETTKWNLNFAKSKKKKKKIYSQAVLLFYFFIVVFNVFDYNICWMQVNIKREL